MVKKGITNTKLSLVPEGVFKKAKLYVYSEDAKHKTTREKRAASNANRRGHNSRRRQNRRKGHYNCRRHRQYVDFMEVSTHIIPTPIMSLLKLYKFFFLEEKRG